MEAEAHKSKNIKFMFEKLASSSIISQPQPSQELSEKIVSFPESVSSQVETRIQNEGENQASTSTVLTTSCNFQSIAKTNEAKSSFQSAINITDSHYDSYFKKPNLYDIQNFFSFHRRQSALIEFFNRGKAFKMKNGTVRNWLTYNEKTFKLFCTVCLVYAKHENRFVLGMNDFSHT